MTFILGDIFPRSQLGPKVRCRQRLPLNFRHIGAVWLQHHLNAEHSGDCQQLVDSHRRGVELE